MAQDPSHFRSMAFLFALNYRLTSIEKLSSITEIHKVREWLVKQNIEHIHMYTDEDCTGNTTYTGIIRLLYSMAKMSRAQKIDFLYIHFTGHGEDTNEGEVLFPSDYDVMGYIRKDAIYRILNMICPTTRVFFVINALHRCPMLSLKYERNPPISSSMMMNTHGHSGGYITVLTSVIGPVTPTARKETDYVAGAMAHIFSETMIHLFNKKKHLLENLLEFQDYMVDELQFQGIPLVPVLSSTYSIDHHPGLFPSQNDPGSEILIEEKPEIEYVSADDSPKGGAKTSCCCF